MLCGRQEMRGHRDSGKIEVDNLYQPSYSYEGNFRAILKYRAACDVDLREMLEGPGERNKYTKRRTSQLLNKLPFVLGRLTKIMKLKKISYNFIKLNLLKADT
ncbi:hypothetical protein WA026_015634 [Henosepilachna vigintioctopunctata]|uniref:Uncharacterized protein n=1 Tax=Henosepilachna vigintioctopunctata TaxID=420089 RepID=A0AAW1VFB8_9CUCU